MVKKICNKYGTKKVDEYLINAVFYDKINYLVWGPTHVWAKLLGKFECFYKVKYVQGRALYYFGICNQRAPG